jgi:hypothetical protein
MQILKGYLTLEYEDSFKTFATNNPGACHIPEEMNPQLLCHRNLKPHTIHSSQETT